MRYKISKSLVMQYTHDGKLAASVSLSHPLQQIKLDGIYVLQAFGNGRTWQEAMKSLAEECEFDEPGFKEVFENLVHKKFLVPADTADSIDGISTSSTKPGLNLSLLRGHHVMLRDAIRVSAYRQAIFANVRGKSVVEIGCGSGILSLFAAQAGARKVVAIEETEIARLAKEMVQANGFENIIRVITAHSRNVELEEPADVIIHELIGTEPFFEDILPSITDARERFLKNRKGRFIPWKLDICCAGIEIDQKDLITREKKLKEAGEFARLYGLDFTPYINHLSEGEKFHLFIPNIPSADFPYRVLSRECLLFSIDFLEDFAELNARQPRTLEIQTPGNLNGVVIFFRAYLDERTQLSNSPFLPKTHWNWNIRTFSKDRSVNPKDKVEINTQLALLTGRQMVKVDIL